MKNSIPQLCLLFLLAACNSPAPNTTEQPENNNIAESTTTQDSVKKEEDKPKPVEKIYQGVDLDKQKYPENLFVIMPNKVTSSGYLRGVNEDYRPEFMIDHDPETWWTPNPNRNGQGAWIQLIFDEEVPLEGFEVWGGSHNPNYPKFGNIYKLNNRVKLGVCEFSNGKSITFQLRDVDNWQWVRFDSTIRTKSIRLHIDEVYKGEKWDDLCISEFLALTSDERLAYYGEGAAKPVVYLYPEKQMEVNVQLDQSSGITKVETTYPAYHPQNGWTVIANPDGKLIEKNSRKPYNYLFWEGTSFRQWSFEDGFVVKGTESAAFLESKLSEMGLTPQEYNDFIVYWLPLMAKNKYNLVRFVNEQYNKDIPLLVTPKPESLLRVYMVFKGIDAPIAIPEQKLKGFERKGFTVVEWGGTALSDKALLLGLPHQ